MSAIGSFLLDTLHGLNTLATVAGSLAGGFLVATNAARILRWYVDRIDDDPHASAPWRLHAARTIFCLAFGVTCLAVFGPRMIALVVTSAHALTTVI